MSLLRPVVAALAPVAGTIAAGAVPPLDPDAPTARRWLVTELAKPPYQAAKPTWFDLASQAVERWLGDLFGHGGGHLAPVLMAIAIVVAAAIVIAALIVFGAPRLSRRRRPVARRTIFGVDDDRSAAELRAAADAAAAAGDWDLAVAELFRALARRLDDAGLVAVLPGTTAHALASGGARALPEHAAGLTRAADVFDGVRYLGRPAREPDHRALAALDDAVAAAVRVAAGTASGVAREEHTTGGAG